MRLGDGHVSSCARGWHKRGDEDVWMSGSSAEDDELEPAPKTGNDVRVHPLSAFRKYWEITTILLVVYTVLVLPFRAAFYLDFYKDLEHSHNIIQQLQVTHIQ